MKYSIPKIKTVEQFIECYQKGQRLFIDLEFENGESFSKLNICDATFKNCWFCADFTYANLSNCKFIDSNLKTSDFSYSNLTNAQITRCSIEGTEYKGAIIRDLVFNNNFAFGSILGLNDFKEIYAIDY